MKLSLLPAILLWIADPVEPFNFQFVQHDLLPPFPEGIRDGLRKQAGLFEQLDEGQADVLEYVHGNFSAVGGWRFCFR